MHLPPVFAIKMIPTEAMLCWTVCIIRHCLFDMGLLLCVVLHTCSQAADDDKSARRWAAVVNSNALPPMWQDVVIVEEFRLAPCVPEGARRAAAQLSDWGVGVDGCALCRGVSKEIGSMPW